MDIDNFLKNVKKSKYDELFTIPKSDVKDEIPHIKKNIFESNILHQADILYLPTSQFGYKYCLVIVDVYNSKIDAVALKSKTGNDIVNGLKTIYITRDILELPLRIQFDNGKEFNNSDVKDFLKKMKTTPKYTLTNRHRQNSVVENANNRLGALILKFQAVNEIENKKKVKSWHTHLNKFIDYLNSKVIKTHDYDPYEDVAGNTDLIEIYNVGDKVRKILDYPITAHDDKRITGKFRSGDIRFSKDVFTIKHIILNPGMPPLYVVNKKNSDDIDSSVAYTKKQLLKVN